MRRRKWIWLFLWILSLIGISLYGGAVSYGLFGGLSVLPFVSFVYLLYVYLRFRIYQEIESRQVICGQSVPYYFVLRNEDRLGFAGIQVRMFPDFSYVENMKEDVEYELLPQDEVLYRSRIVCKYRGEYEVGVKEVVLTDFFGIFCFRYQAPGTIRAIVKPRLVKINKLVAMSDMIMELERENYVSQNEPGMEVRGYIAGDNLKRIHWKSVARSGKLWVRKDIGTEKQRIMIAFDTCRYSREPQNYLPLESKMLECLLALTLFWAEINVPIRVCYGQNGIQRADVAGIQAFEEFYVRIADLTFREHENPNNLLEQLLLEGDLRETKILVCLFHEWNDEMMQMAETVVASGTHVIAYIVTDDDLSDYIKYNTERRRVVSVSVAGDLEGVL